MIDPSRLTKIADQFSRSLDKVERRSNRGIITVLRRSLTATLLGLRRAYQAYLGVLGPIGYDPARNPIRRPGAYDTADAAARFASIVTASRSFLTDLEVQEITVQHERDLTAAAALGGTLAARLMDNAGPFAPADPVLIREASRNVGALIRGEGVRFREQLVGIVSEGATRGWGPKRLEVQIRRALQGTTQRRGLEQRAATIARTELARVYATASLDAARARGDSYVRVLASNDERVCPTCASRNGRVYPTDRILLPFHPRCVLGDTKVSPGLLAAAIRSKYRGNVVSVTLENGDVFTVTAKHPVLTPSGWVNAEALRHGDDLIGHELHRSMPVVTESPDLHQVPATAEDIFAAFVKSGSVSTIRVPASPLDLHGDGAFIEGDIDIVRSESLLDGYIHSGHFDEASNEQGVVGGVQFRPFSTLGRVNAGLLWHSAAANGSVSRLREAESLLRGGLSHSEEHRIAAIAWRDPVLAQERRDGASLHAKALGDGLDTGSINECSQCGSFVVDRSITGEGDSSGGKVLVDYGFGDVQRLGDIGDVHPGLVERHKIVNVENNLFHGFVYTFETFAGAYTIGAASRIITQNCRCVAVFVPNEAVQERDPDTQDVLLDSERWREEHERGVVAYAEGLHRRELDGLQSQRAGLRDPGLIEAMDRRIAAVEERGPDMAKARSDLARALRTPTASEKALYPTNPLPLGESVALFR